MEFISNHNKGLIWGLLQESEVFNGIENDKFTNIQSMFEDTISHVYRTNATLTLLEKNKLTMNTMIKKINDEKTRPTKKIQIVYRAEDLQHKREQDFNLKLKEQQDDLNKLINPTKPKEVSFSDVNSNDDAPIGDEMDRLIAERLASRERELEIPSITKEAEDWLSNNGNNSNIINSRINNSVNIEAIPEKKVSFNKNIENDMTDRHIQTSMSRVNTMIQNDIFNKLKRKTNEIQLDIVDTSNISNISNTNDTTPGRMMNIEQEIKLLKDNQEKILSMCSQIIYILQENKE